ncbi:MAG TPA: AgmX/PglI C-terminal domain-containing protein [Terriglobia bacterium]|nr:AgmX/PglI C-terminal domain-containing protein [Terriglobia bacterium]
MGIVIARALVGFVVLLAAPLPALGADGGASDRLSKEEIYRVVRAHFLPIKACYEAQMKKAPSLVGEIDVAWDIEKDGRVAKARVIRTTMNSEPVEDCIVAEVAGWRFPAAGDRTIVGRFPFVFKSGVPPPPPAPAPSR